MRRGITYDMLKRKCNSQGLLPTAVVQRLLSRRQWNLTHGGMRMVPDECTVAAALFLEVEELYADHLRRAHCKPCGGPTRV